MFDKIICIGKNYLEHALELGDKIPEQPVLFLKPASVLLQAQKWHDTVHARFPQSVGEVHHEIEIVLRVGNDANSIDAVTLGLDMTLRTRQAQLKKAGHPWTTAKVFPDAAIIGPWIASTAFVDYLKQEFTLSINGTVRQGGCGDQMLLKPIALLRYIQQFFPLCKGDLIFTGTPAGVGEVLKNSTAILKWSDQYTYQVQWQ